MILLSDVTIIFAQFLSWFKNNFSAVNKSITMQLVEDFTTEENKSSSASSSCFLLTMKPFCSNFSLEKLRRTDRAEGAEVVLI